MAGRIIYVKLLVKRNTRDAMDAEIRALVAAELRKKVNEVETIENPATARLTDESAG